MPLAMNEILWALQPDAVSTVFARWHELEQPRADAPEAAPHEPALGYSLSHGVAVIHVDGPLDRQAHFGWRSGQRLATGYDEIAQAVDAARDNPQARAILLSFNSPGGAVPGCKELADHIAAVAAVKPCAAYADGLCASAAFWLASATGTIYAPRTATVGSIGVVMVHADMSRAWDRVGVSFSYITGGKFKAVGNPHAPLSDDDRAYLQQHAQALHAVFREDVARNLGLDLGQAETWGDGQVFVDHDAESLGLVSGVVSGLPEAVNHLAAVAVARDSGLTDSDSISPARNAALAGAVPVRSFLRHNGQSKDTAMNKEQLAAQHPELLAELQAEFKAESDKAMDAVKAEATASALALLEAAVGKDARDKVETLLQAGVTPEQLKAISALYPQQPAPEEPARDMKADILQGITNATTQPLPDAKTGAPADDIRAAVDRMAKL